MKSLLLALLTLAATLAGSTAATTFYKDTGNPAVTATLTADNTYAGTLVVDNQSTATIDLASFGNPSPYVAGWSTPDAGIVAPGETQALTLYFWGSPENLVFTGTDSNCGSFTLTAVPETSSALLGGMGFIALIRRQRI